MKEHRFGLNFEQSDLSDEELQEMINPSLKVVENIEKHKVKTRSKFRKADKIRRWDSERNLWICIPAGNKTIYDSETLASEAARMTELSRSIRLNTYVCEHCMGWHLTSNTKHL